MKVVLRLQTNTIISEVLIEANRPVMLGRGKDVQFKVPDEFMSNSHLKITLIPPRLEVTDLESKNGTYLNGIRIEQSDVFLGDEIKAGTTKMTVLAEKMDQDSVYALTFPGPTKDRISHGLHLDFTGARISNQNYGSKYPLEKKPTFSSNKELEVRKKAHSKIKLSKQEIKLRNKKKTSVASTIDFILFIVFLSSPLIATNFMMILDPLFLKDQRLFITGGAELICLLLFYFLNFKISKFTFGERLSGIRELYINQETT